jgi:hypothetical protein
MIAEVQRAHKKGARAIRIHDSGDFYLLEYLMNWFLLARACPEVRFYAYTKMVALVQKTTEAGLVPANFRLIQSLGGLGDSRIDRSLPHSRIFSSLQELKAAGYMDASESDRPAAFETSALVGLVIHGAKQKKFDASIMQSVQKKG